MTAVGSARPGYRDVLRDREFRAVLAADGLSVVGDQVAVLAVALLVYERTGSALAASATYACSYLSWMLSGPVLSVLADRMPRRRVVVLCDLTRAALVVVLAVAHLPLWAVFSVLVAVGLLAPPFDAARSALLAEVLRGEKYVVGNAVLGGLNQAGLVIGFVGGGALVALLGVRTALLVDAITFATSALLFGLAVQSRPAADVTRGSVVAGLTSGARLVAHTRELRTLLGWGVLIGCVAIVPEGLAVTAADELGGGAVAAGLLSAALPAGFVLGSWLVLRVDAPRRRRGFPWLVALTASCLMLSPWVDRVELLVPLWVLAGIGGALQVVANASFVQAVPAELRGRAFGVAGSVLMAAQGLALVGGGALADVTGARTAVAAVALAGLCAVLGSRVISVHAQGPGRIGRGLLR